MVLRVSSIALLKSSCPSRQKIQLRFEISLWFVVKNFMKFPGHLLITYWENPLAVLDRVCNLLVAHLRSNRIWADQEKESIRFFNAAIDFLLPVFAFGNALPVNPGIQLVISQRVNDLAGEVNVTAGVGDEYMGHGYYLIRKHTYLPNQQKPPTQFAQAVGFVLRYVSLSLRVEIA